MELYHGHAVKGGKRKWEKKEAAPRPAQNISANVKIIRAMENRNIVCLLVIVFLFCGMRNRSVDKYIEGLFYLDHAPVRVEFSGGKITGVVRMDELSDKNNKNYIAPGLIDNQVNGYNGISFIYEGYELTEKDVVSITKAIWKSGVTTYLPTLRSNPQDLVVKNITLLAKFKDNPTLRGSIPGFHLEGPYISPLDGFRGSHASKNVRKPDWREFLEVYEASGRNILQVTMAPEVEGAMELITKLRELNIVVAIGHTNANTQQITEAADRGAQTVTHIANGMGNTINRHSNPLWPQLSEDRLMISMIADGFHLLPEQLRVFYKAKGPEKTILTSDATRYAGLAPGKYLNAEGDTILLTAEGAARYLSRNVLSGSAAPISKGIGNVMKATGCSLAEAIQMASTNSARLYNLTDRGELKAGMRADLILFTLDDFKMEIKKTIISGEVVYDASL
jgi:N-acetylglucosamine-6-phosphate deacetylase